MRADVDSTVSLSLSVRRWTLALACAAAFMLVLDVTVVNVALPQIRSSLGASYTDLQWVIDSYTLTLAVFLLTAGVLADRSGRKRIFLLGIVLFAVSSLAAGAAPSALVLNLARGSQGVGAAMLFATAPALIGNEFGGAARARAFGLFGGVTGLALAVGPLVGGALTAASWRWIFLVNVPVGAACIIAGVLRLRDSRADVSRPLDGPGLASFALALCLLLLGFFRAQHAGWADLWCWLALVGSLSFFAVFWTVERRRAGAAMLDLSFFRIPTFIGISVSTLLVNLTAVAVIFFEVLYLENVLGYSALGAGIRFLPLTLTIFVVATFVAPLGVRVPPGLLVGGAVSLMAAGLFLVSLVLVWSSWLALLPSMVAIGAGMGLFNPPRATLTIGVVEPGRAGTASGVGETFQQVGIAVGIAAIGGLFSARVTSSFLGSGVAQALPGDRDVAAERIVAGGAGAVGDLLPPALAGDVATAVREAFAHGLAISGALSGVLAVVGAVIAFACIRARDLHSSATGDLETS